MYFVYNGKEKGKHLRGMYFPAGEPVLVDDKAMQKKCLAMVDKDNPLAAFTVSDKGPGHATSKVSKVFGKKPAKVGKASK